MPTGFNIICHWYFFFSSFSSQEQVAPLRPPDHLRRPLRDRRGAELFTHCLHPAGQWELRAAADLSGAHSKRHLQVHGDIHHGVCGLHDWHVQPILLLPGRQVQPCLHHVSYACRRWAARSVQSECVSRKWCCLNVCTHLCLHACIVSIKPRTEWKRRSRILDRSIWFGSHVAVVPVQQRNPSRSI